ncbi:MAG TPA: hypothetical protein VNZ67_02610 [bacterium]|nr:hypothetical protein [bacterium]
MYAMLVEGRDPKERRDLDATLNAPLQARSPAGEAARRGAAFAAVGRAQVVR